MLKSIAGKLTGLAWLNAAAFVAIALIAFMGFSRVESLSSNIARVEITEVIDNALLERTITNQLFELKQFAGQCNQKSYEPAIGSGISDTISALVETVPASPLKNNLNDFKSVSNVIIQTCENLNRNLKGLHEITLKVGADLLLMENIIGKSLIEQTLQGKSTNHLDQVMVLVAGLNETFLLIGKNTAEQILYAEVVMSDDRAVVKSIDDMVLRLQSIPASTASFQNTKRALSSNLIAYRAELLNYQQAQNALNQAVVSSSVVISGLQRNIVLLNQESSSRIEVVQSVIVEVVRNSKMLVLLLSLTIAFLSILIINLINRKDIKKPLNDTLQLIQNIKNETAQSTSEPRIDEWGIIHNALLNMSNDLSLSQTELLASRERLRIAIEGGGAGLWDWNIETNEVYYSPLWASMLGYTQDELKPSLDTWEELVDPLQKAVVLQHVENYLEKHDSVFKIEFRMKHKDGSWVEILSRAQLACDPDGQELSPKRLVGIHTDITVRKRAEMELQQVEHEQRTLITALPDIIIQFNNERRCIFASDNATPMLGISPDALLGKRFLDLDFEGNQNRIIDSTVKQTFTTGFFSEVETVFNTSQGQKTYNWTFAPDSSNKDEICTVLAVVRDITKLKDQQKALEQNAHYDLLTQLPNRVLFADRLTHAMHQSKRNGLKLAVVYIDLDGFKEINDRYGHDVGDHLLRIVSARMKDSLREGDTLARLGGDEFVAVLQELPDTGSCELMLSRILKATSEMVINAGAPLHVTASLGVTFYPQEKEIEADQLLRQADQAMYQVKLAGKNSFHIYDLDQDRSVRIQHDNLAEISNALCNEEFCLYYQPKVNMKTGEVIGAEALIRWQHPERGLLPPVEFLPLIEHHDLNVEVGNWVFESVFKQINIWNNLGITLPVSINVSSLQIQQPAFVKNLLAMLENYPDIIANGIELEILETSALSDLAHTSQVIQGCIEHGIKASIDDFGTGYSTLAYLKSLPVDYLKIDKSFVLGMLDNEDDLAILKGVLGLTEAFHRTAIAEGVESIEHGHALLDLNCELAQGYVIAYPMPPENIPSWLSTWRVPSSWSNRNAEIVSS